MMIKDKRILVLSISPINNLDDKGVHTSLLKELSINNTLDIITLSSKTESIQQYNKKATIHYINNKKIFNVNVVRKAINLLTLNNKFKKVIKKRLLNNKYDLILFKTPPITLNSTIKYAKKKFNAKTYLSLKDIFPQNAVDLNMFSKRGLIYRYFRVKEKRLYKISDYIGAMSKGNLEYILNNNKIDKNKLEINPNSIEITKNTKQTIEQRNSILKQYSLPTNKRLFIYGGNLGAPQGMDYILNVIKENESSDNHIVIVGDGTEKNKLINYIKNHNIVNTTFINKLNKEDYDELLKACDVGLIFLDKRFTIPNIPSRLLSYLDYNKPVIAATDVNTDLKDIIEEGNFGYWCESENPNDMIDLFEKIKENDNINVLGNNGRNYLEENYDVKISAKLILDKLKDV